jgi:FkbM family methyltransferase
MKKYLRLFFGKHYFKFLPIYWRAIAALYPFFYKKKGVLVYAGINVGETFRTFFFKYDRVIGFEPNPSNFEKIKHFNQFKNVKIYNYALSDKDETSELFLPDNSNNSASASLSDFSSENRYQSKGIIKVKCINLGDFLKELEITSIEFYISDIEGYDLKALKTLKLDFIDKSLIKKIQVEAVNDLEVNPYKSVSNFESEIDELLKENYTKIGRGSGMVIEGDDSSGKTLDLLYQLK